MWELWDIFKLLFPLSDLWDIGLMGCRTCDVSDLWGDTPGTAECACAALRNKMAVGRENNEYDK
jgi:hypothetical protein